MYAALAADSPRLAAMGLRAVMDMVLSDTVGDAERNFFKKLPRHGSALPSVTINAAPFFSGRGQACTRYPWSNNPIE